VPSVFSGNSSTCSAAFVLNQRSAVWCVSPGRARRRSIVTARVVTRLWITASSAGAKPRRPRTGSSRRTRKRHSGQQWRQNSDRGQAVTAGQQSHCRRKLTPRARKVATQGGSRPRVAEMVKPQTDPRAWCSSPDGRSRSGVYVEPQRCPASPDLTATDTQSNVAQPSARGEHVVPRAP
jgi:hypothetical protein